ncbi:MAG: DegT/DnrJ/EryC1/StrS family aminotransferase [Spirochaetia bacterium]|nr:DegT/DnrJ/EryC1/StrS family aminotransferase [Spirochaetia bacterium]
MATVTLTKTKLAQLGGEKTIRLEPGNIFTWPIVTEEDEAAVLEVLRAGKMSGTDVTEKFEKEFAVWQGTHFALGCNNGTAALHSAMWAAGVTKGTEIIAPSITYWATAMPALNLGAAIQFADVDPVSLTLDPKDIEHRIHDNTRAIVVLHAYGHPADMDPIMAIAAKYNLKVIEDVSHAHGARYKGRKVGTIGDVAAMSMMTGKSFPIGEGGMLVTNNRLLYERAVAFGHYERTGESRYSNAERVVSDPSLQEYSGLPLGGVKYRMHQLSSAMGRGQLRHYDARVKKIQDGMNYFWDQVKDLPGLTEHRIKTRESDMGGWYAPIAGYKPEALGGLPIETFCKAVSAEGVHGLSAGVNKPLHLHPLFHTADIYGDGKPTMLANTTRDIRLGKGSLPVAEAASGRNMYIPWFKNLNRPVIDEYAAAFRKVVENYQELLK